MYQSIMKEKYQKFYYCDSTQIFEKKKVSVSYGMKKNYRNHYKKTFFLKKKEDKLR